MRLFSFLLVFFIFLILVLLFFNTFFLIFSPHFDWVKLRKLKIFLLHPFQDRFLHRLIGVERCFEFTEELIMLEILN